MSSIADNFNRADNDAPGTSSDAQFTWNELATDVDIFSNQLSADGTGLARADFDMASDNFYAQAEYHSSENTGVCARFSSSVSDTLYLLQVANSTTLQLYKQVTGTFTQLGANVTISHTDGNVYKLECNGTTIKGFKGGVEQISQTDSSISGAGNRRTGFRSGSGNAFWDNFEAADLAAGDPEGSLIGGKLLRGGLLLHGVLGR